jgi:hypothetical protein
MIVLLARNESHYAIGVASFVPPTAIAEVAVAADERDIPSQRASDDVT